jgi:hypothetical protein
MTVLTRVSFDPQKRQSRCDRSGTVAIFSARNRSTTAALSVLEVVTALAFAVLACVVLASVGRGARSAPAARVSHRTSPAICDGFKAWDQRPEAYGDSHPCGVAQSTRWITKHVLVRRGAEAEQVPKQRPTSSEVQNHRASDESYLHQDFARPILGLEPAPTACILSGAALVLLDS